jgi:glucose-6-phosphate dehydrogenase assembly protein OpcA
MLICVPWRELICRLIVSPDLMPIERVVIDFTSASSADIALTHGFLFLPRQRLKGMCIARSKTSAVGLYLFVQARNLRQFHAYQFRESIQAALAHFPYPISRARRSS